MFSGALLLGSMVAVTAIYGRFLSRKTLLIFWAGFVLGGAILHRGLGMPFAALIFQVFVVIGLAIRGATSDVSSGM